jgi:hypothetical protein
MIRRAIELGRREYDFLAGVARYSERLSTHRRRIVAVRATRRRSVVEAARLMLEIGVDQLRVLRDRVRKKAGTAS